MEINQDLVKGNITTIILNALKDKDRYGYEIIKSLEESSNGILRMKEGTLYPILHNLEFEGYVISTEKKSERGRKRKYYKLTKSGLKLLESKKKQREGLKILIDQLVARVSYAR